jgi:hypothetical protein
LIGAAGGFVDGVDEGSGADSFTARSSGSPHEFVFVDFLGVVVRLGE